jgi:membrane fusion protein (multidrug efflux system)
MIPSRHTRTLLVSALIAAPLSTGVYACMISSSDEEEVMRRFAGDVQVAASSGPPSREVEIPVEGMEARRGTLMIAVSAAGQAEAGKRTVIAAQVGGRVAALPVRESDGVGAAQTLLTVDPVEYALAVQEAQAGVRDAEARFREITLFDDRIPDAATRAERERIARARSGLETAEVRLRRARLDLARTRLSAPFAGRIADLKVVLGQWVRPGDALMTVVDLDPIRVEVQVLEGEVGYLAPGRQAKVSFAAFPAESFAGRIETINPLVESGTRTARVTVLVPNPGGRILPGMYARVALEARRYEDRVLVPRAALLERDRRSMLFVLEEGLARWRYVTPGLQNDSLVEIVPNPETDSVAPGEVVLTDGHYTLIHDARVKRVDDVKVAGGRPQ